MWPALWTFTAHPGTVQPNQQPRRTRSQLRYRFVDRAGDAHHTEIYVMGADGTNQTRLTNNTETDTQPAFSPDGTMVAFASWRDGNSEVYVMGADGTNQTRLTDPGGTELEPDWGPAPVAPAVTIADLAASVKALALDSGTEASLLRKLQEAVKNVARDDVAGACDKVASFSEQVAALAGKKITTSDAEQLITDAAAVRDGLGCVA